MVSVRRIEGSFSGGRGPAPNSTAVLSSAKLSCLIAAVACYCASCRVVADGLEQSKVITPIQPFDLGELDGFKDSHIFRVGDRPGP